jgi:hypothetical protein
VNKTVGGGGNRTEGKTCLERVSTRAGEEQRKVKVGCCVANGFLWMLQQCLHFLQYYLLDHAESPRPSRPPAQPLPPPHARNTKLLSRLVPVDTDHVLACTCTVAVRLVMMSHMWEVRSDMTMLTCGVFFGFWGWEVEVEVEVVSAIPKTMSGSQTCCPRRENSTSTSCSTSSCPTSNARHTHTHDVTYLGGKARSVRRGGVVCTNSNAVPLQSL